MYGQQRSSQIDKDSRQGLGNLRTSCFEIRRARKTQSTRSHFKVHDGFGCSENTKILASMAQATEKEVTPRKAIEKQQVVEEKNHQVNTFRTQQ